MIALNAQKAGAYLKLGRMSNTPTILSNVLAGATLAGVTDLNGAIFLAALALGLIYTAGMFLNDIFDRDWDRLNRPERPLATGEISLAEAKMGAALLFGAGLTLLLYLGRSAFTAGLVLSGLVFIYDRWHKRNPFAPLLMGLCRAGVYGVSYLCFAEEVSLRLGFVATIVVLYVGALSVVARFEARKNIKGLIGPLIAGISLLDSAIALALGAYGQALACLAIFALVLYLQSKIQGT